PEEGPAGRRYARRISKVTAGCSWNVLSEGRPSTLVAVLALGRAKLPNPPTGRLGIVHSCLKRRRSQAPKSPNRQVGDRSFLPKEAPQPSSQIPQPEGWGSFIPAYKKGA